MKTIVIYNSKGGVGKTTIADELAFTCERDGQVVQIVDADGQGGLIHQPGPVQGAEVTIVDMPGQITASDNQFLAAADVIVVPTKWSARDRVVTAGTLATIAKATPGTPTIIAINEVNMRSKIDRTAAQGDVMGWIHNLKAHGAAVNVVACLLIPSSVKVREAADRGRSITDIAKNAPAAVAFAGLYELVIAAMSGDVRSALPIVQGRIGGAIFAKSA